MLPPSSLPLSGPPKPAVLPGLGEGGLTRHPSQDQLGRLTPESNQTGSQPQTPVGSEASTPTGPHTNIYSRSVLTLGMRLAFPSSCHLYEWSKILLARNYNQLVRAVQSNIILLNCTSRGD